MDRDQQELKSIGFGGILKKTFKIIYKEKKFFAKITFSFILPLTIILLGLPVLNLYIALSITHGPVDSLSFFCVILAGTLFSGNLFSGTLFSFIFDSLSIFCLLILAGTLFSLVFFLLPTSAIVYTIACIYTAKQFTFKTIFLSVVPKAWIRLIVTFAIQFLIMLAYNCVALAVFIPLLVMMNDYTVYYLIILLVLYVIGFVYINTVWNLANVVSVLEDFKGCGAMKKSIALLKGKMLVASALFVLIYLPLVLVQIAFELILNSGRFGIASKVGYGAICLLLTLVLILLGLVIQTIVYFVCKSFHGETIDKSYLANHLEAFMPGNVSALAERNVLFQLEQLNI